MSIELIIVVLVMVLGFASLYYLIISQTKKTDGDREIEDVVNKVFGMSIGKIASQSKQVLEGEKEQIKTDLANKQAQFERLVRQLQDDMARRQEEIRTLEQDRVKKFGEITTAIAEHRKLTDELKVSTHQLATVLSNNQQRGEWGERIAEDLLRANGLVEGTHYTLQSKLGDSSLKPDIMLLLPDRRTVPVDVKFPYSEIQKMSLTEVKSARAAHLKQFGLDLKTKVKKVAEYIDPGQDTLDYAIMFVPNEMVFSFINQKFPDIVDEALRRRVLIVSPFSFLIVARTVMESYRNFMIGDQLREVVKHVDEFVGEWGRFKTKFEKYGRSITTLQSDYEDLMGTRVRGMERRIEKIQAVQQGNLLTDSSEQIKQISPKTD